MPVVVSGTASARGIDRRAIARKGRFVLGRIGLEKSELSIALVGDEEMRRLNREWRRRDRPTDVLSFSLREGRFGELSNALGDVVISLETAARQARERRLTIGEEVDRLLVHGILHLAGYDHERSAPEARRMRRKESDCVRALRQAMDR